MYDILMSAWKATNTPHLGKARDVDISRSEFSLAVSLSGFVDA